MERNLTEGSVFKNIIYFSLPYLLSYFLQTLYGMADLFIIGQFEGVASTTAVSIGSQVMHMLTVMIVGLAMGATINIGQAIGARDKKRAATDTGNTATLFMVLSVILTVVLYFCVNGIYCVFQKSVKRGVEMSPKTDTEVIIGGRVLTLSGYESEEYLQKVASYINNKLAEYNRVESFRRQPADIQNILVELNIADDYFKAKKQIEEMEEEAASKEKELYDLKHELIASQIKLDNTEKSLRTLQQDQQESSRQIVRLETEIRGMKDKK